jgi:copper chaperone
MSEKYRVEGMTCGGCANSVTKAIKAVAPDAKVDVDLEAKLVAVDGLDNVDIIRKAVEDAGFDFAGRA